ACWKKSTRSDWAWQPGWPVLPGCLMFCISIGSPPVDFRLLSIGQWLYRRAENVLAFMLAAMFAAFILQVIFRYVINFPIGWTHEVSCILWSWMVLWGAAFVLREEEEIRFDLIYASAGPTLR